MTSPEHPQQSFWRQWIFSLDHKVIGLQYGLTSLSFLLLGFMLTQIVGWVQVARLDGQTAAEQDSQDD